MYPQNPSRGIPTIGALYVLSDYETGFPLAVMDAGFITGLRTAAASAVATKYLAREDAKTLGILGTGVQGFSHLWAMKEVSSVEEVVIYNRSADKAREFKRQYTERFGLPIEIAPSEEAVCRASDILVLATTAAEPIVRREWLKPGVHINAVGSHSPGARELDGPTVAAARIVVDSREANKVECGDLLIPMKEGKFDESHFADEIGEVAAGKKPGRTSNDQITIYKSVGIAVEDVATGALVLQRAREKGVGTQVDL